MSIEYLAGMVFGLLAGALIGVTVGVQLGNWCRRAAEKECHGKTHGDVDFNRILQQEHDQLQKLHEAVARLDLVAGTVIDGKICIDRMEARNAGMGKGPEGANGDAKRY